MSEFGPKPPHTDNNEQNEVRSEENKLIRETMDVYLSEGKELENSENLYEQEAIQRATAKVNELNFYVENNILTREEANSILALEMARIELNGLIDPKTNSLNENGINERLAAEISHINRHPEESLSVGYFDLVGFKSVNDLLGHETGDKVLAYFHQFVKENIRTEDFGGRLHGDEFLYAFPSSDPESISEKLSPQLLREQFSEYVKEKLKDEGVDTQNINIYARVGLASFEQGDSVKSLKDKADMEMNAQRNLDDTDER